MSEQKSNLFVFEYVLTKKELESIQTRAAALPAEPQIKEDIERLLKCVRYLQARMVI